MLQGREANRGVFLQLRAAFDSQRDASGQGPMDSVRNTVHSPY
jgi:hypothetical protein